MPTFVRKRIFLLTSAVIISLASIAAATGWYYSQILKVTSIEPQDDTLRKASNVLSALPVVRVRMFEVGSGHSAGSQNIFTGTVRARYETPLAFRVAGKILKRRIEVGQTVNQGDVLFELDSEDYVLQQRSAEANLLVATASVKQSTAEERRLGELRRSNAISQSEYDLGLSARDVALGRESSTQRQLELAKNQLAYCRLLADTSGVVISVQAETGQVVTAGMPVCILAQVDQLEAVVDIPENRSSLAQGLPASVQFWSLPNEIVSARLRELSPVADTITRTFRARFSIEKPPTAIHLGMTATVTWEEQRPANMGGLSSESRSIATKIPASAIIQYEGRSAVWLATPEASNPSVFHIRPRMIQVNNYGDKMIEVTSGLSQGQLIVSAGVQKLDEAMKVSIWELEK